MTPVAPDVLLQAVVASLPDAAFVSTCGFISRDLQHVRDAPSHFYLVGAMGMALPVGLGVALGRPDRAVVVIDGDGSLLMNVGALAMVGEQRPSNLLHLVLDNGVHESTGGQRTIRMDWIGDVARAVGYRDARSIDSLEPAQWLAAARPVLLHARIDRRQRGPSPRIRATPTELRDRFGDALQAVGNIGTSR